MNLQVHTHDLTYSGYGGRIDYGDRHGYVHMFHDDGPPQWWPDWYLKWKIRRVTRSVIRRHDRATQREVRAQAKRQRSEGRVLAARVVLERLQPKDPNRWGITQ